MRVVLNVFATLLTLVGLIWFLQGVNVLPGSFMTGQTRWAVYGGIAVALGIAIFAKFWVRRIVVNTIAVILLLIGTVWFLQGMNVLPGSGMSGQTRWAINGGVAAVLGIGLLIVNNRRRPVSLR